jgi:ABC-type tungstate transport system substrate-binding protein
VMERVLSLADAVWRGMRHHYVIVVFRLVVGITFLVAAAAKLSEGSAFVDDVIEYDLLPEALAEVFGTVLPWIEIAVGSLLIVGFKMRWVAGVAVLISLSLVIANGLVLYRGLDLACGCFGDLATLETRDAIIIDSVLLILSLLIIARRRDFLNLDLWIRQ